jgi:hypothetical protein
MPGRKYEELYYSQLNGAQVMITGRQEVFIKNKRQQTGWRFTSAKNLIPQGRLFNVKNKKIQAYLMPIISTSR